MYGRGYFRGEEVERYMQHYRTRITTDRFVQCPVKLTGELIGTLDLDDPLGQWSEYLGLRIVRGDRQCLERLQVRVLAGHAARDDDNGGGVEQRIAEPCG